MKGKRKEGKKGEKREINKGKNYDLILKGEKTIYFGGGEEYDFFGKYIPLFTLLAKKQNKNHHIKHPNPTHHKTNEHNPTIPKPT